MAVGCLLSQVVASFIYRGYYPLGTRYFVILAGVALIALVAVVWRSLRPPRMHIPVLSSRRRWVFMAPGLVSLVFLCYAWLKLVAPSYLPWDPFLVF
jgi:hypothetical protein